MFLLVVSSLMSLFGKVAITQNSGWCQRSHHSSRRSHDLPGGLGKPVVGPRVTGEPLKPDAATRNAERPKGEKRKLASRLPGDSYSRFARCADGKGRESGTSPAAYPTSNIRSRINN